MSPSNKPPSLAVVVTDLGTGGAESLLARLLPKLTQHFSVTVHSLRTRGVHADALEDHGITVHAHGADSARRLPGAWHALKARLQEDEPDIVQTHLYHADLLGGWAARRAGIRPIIWGLHNSGLGWNTMKPATRAVIRACAWSSRRVPSRIISCSQAAIAQHVSIGYDPSLFEFIPNGFDLDQFRFDPAAASEVRNELNIPSDAPIVGLVARMNPQKDHATFVSMAARLNVHRPDVHYVIVGQGVDDPGGIVAQQISQAGIASVCRLLGRRPDVARLMSAFDMLVSSSVAEAFPLVIGEAMATQVPCVVTDVGDSAFLVGDTGRVAPPSDPEALARGCQDLLSMSAESRQALRFDARDRIRKYFQLDAIAERYVSIYLDELGRSGSR